ncbi:endonuclease III-like protein 1, partial [Leptotrombidium deliense]
MIKSTNRKKGKGSLALETIKTEVNEAETTLNQQNEWQPKNWNLLLENIKQMRKMNEAPVDTMGCDQCHDKLETDPKTQRFQTLVALMLSSQTKDEITFATMTNLKENGLT